jgi:hypothetical protein
MICQNYWFLLCENANLSDPIETDRINCVNEATETVFDNFHKANIEMCAVCAETTRLINFLHTPEGKATLGELDV